MRNTVTKHDHVIPSILFSIIMLLGEAICHPHCHWFNFKPFYMLLN
jgi:hypothetical protein